MEKISLVMRKDSGLQSLRFRLRDGRGVDLCYVSSLKFNTIDLDKFNPDGSLRKNITRYNIDLKKAIDTYKQVITLSYHNLKKQYDKTNLTSKLLKVEIEKNLPRDKEPDFVEQHDTSVKLLARFKQYIEESYKDNVFAEKRYKIYIYTAGCLERFLKINKLQKISPAEMHPNILSDFQNFLANEYQYVPKYPKLYKDLIDAQIPKKKRELNTVTTRMKMMKAFFAELVDLKELDESPFNQLTRKKKRTILSEKYDDPIFLRREEIQTIIDTDVPESLQSTKDAFLVQCAFGCRLGDFAALNMDKIRVTPEGIPYIHYIPQKTRRTNTKLEEIETPILYYAFEIIMRNNFHFPILNYSTGENGYNVKIKELLKYCKIDREVKEYDSEKEDYKFLPVYEVASSKLARSTHVDILSKITIDPYASGLHSRGSSAVNHYTKLEIRDKFYRLCIAFSQPLYTVNKFLTILSLDGRITDS